MFEIGPHFKRRISGLSPKRPTVQSVVVPRHGTVQRWVSGKEGQAVLLLKTPIVTITERVAPQVIEWRYRPLPISEILRIPPQELPTPIYNSSVCIRSPPIRSPITRANRF